MRSGLSRTLRGAAGFLCLSLVMADGVSGEDAFEENLTRRIAAARKEVVPLPESTPFDHDPKAKSVYLEEYASAYRFVLAAVDVGCHMGIKGYYEKAFQAGWSDGREAGMKDHPEKVAEMLGIPVEDYLRYLRAN